MSSSFNRRDLLVFGALSAIGFVSGASVSAQTRKPAPAAARNTPGTNIDRAGRSQTDGNRMARSYAQVLLGVEPDVGLRAITESTRNVDASFQTIELAVPATGPLRQSLKLAADDWAEVKRHFLRQPTRGGLYAMYVASERFSESAAGLTRALTESSRQPAAALTNTAAMQRTRVMQIARGYLLQQAGVDVGQGVRIARTSFDSAHTSLEKAAETTPAIRAQLDAVKIQFGYLATAVDQRNVDAAKFSVAAVSASERIVELMDDVVRGYALQVTA
jgi:hypothetical protein